jgi:hypothetical protein
MARKAAVSPDVFVNVPFDPGYEPLFVALIAGLTAFGAAPRSVVELDPGERRLDRLIKHIHACGASVSDLSRVQTSRSGKHTVPRFNMPLRAWADRQLTRKPRRGRNIGGSSSKRGPTGSRSRSRISTGPTCSSITARRNAWSSSCKPISEPRGRCRASRSLSLTPRSPLVRQ